MSANDATKLRECLLGMADAAFDIQSQLTAIQALGPENGGQGEAAKAKLVEKLLAATGFPVPERLDSPDPRVESGFRPNLVARLEGKSPRTLWLFGHLDVVPPGDPAAWHGDPWKVRREDDLIFGRGVEDNQQAVTSMLILAQAITSLGIKPELSLGLVFMADEECGSKHGLDYVLSHAPDFFKGDDYYIVPDGGSPDGSLVEIAEKAQLWLKFEVLGKQCHASTPGEGKNAFVAASALVCALGELYKIFPAKNPLFMPPCSTFTPTRHDANVPSVNILPGKDVFYMDCRLLPECSKDLVLMEGRRIAGEIGRDQGVAINVEVVHYQQSTATPEDTPVMKPLALAIREIYGVPARPVGIGGATVAAFLRQKNLPGIVWSRILNTCHMPDECSSLSATCGDAAVFAAILMGRE